jgi:hypothetical protein
VPRAKTKTEDEVLPVLVFAGEFNPDAATGMAKI